MISKLYAIITKNFKQLFGSKSSSLIILFGPLFLILITGLALSNAGLRDINVGLYFHEDSELSHIILQQIQEKEFHTTILDSIEECKKSVKEEKNHICVEIKAKPNKLSRYDSRAGYEAIFYVDYSKVRLVWAIINSVRSIIDKESTEITSGIIDKISANLEVASEVFSENKDTLDEVIDTVGLVKNEIHDLREKIGSATIGQELIIPLENSLNNQKNALNNLNNVINSLSAVPGAAPYISNLNTNRVIIENEIAGLQFNLNQIKGVLENKNILDRDARTVLLDIENKLDNNLENIQRAKSELNKIEGDLENIKDIKAEDIINPIPVSITPVTGQGAASISSSLTYLDYLFPSITALIIVFVSMLLSTTLTMKERKSIANFRNEISPTNNYLFLIGLYIFSFILIILQVFILFFVGKIFFNLNITSNLLVVSLILFLFISLLIFLGLILGYLFNSEETAIVGSVSLSILMLIASSLILPVETMPGIIGNIIKFNPFVIAETALRQILIFDLPINSIFYYLSLLFIYLFIFIILSYIIVKYSKKEI